MMMYSKIATIRSRQLGERSRFEKECKKQDHKQELYMELERLKTLDRDDEVKRIRDNQIKHGREVLMEQMKYRELERQRQKEEMLKERDLMNLKLKHNDEENDLKAKKRQEYELKLGLEVLEANKQFILDKEKKKLEDQELDRKIIQYNEQKQKREDEEIAEKLRIAELKENEVILLRKKQEKAMDRNAELDFIRAKRANENKEREDRKKVLEETLLYNQKKEEMIISNQQQKKEKQFQIVEQAKKAKDEFETIIKRQSELDEVENKKQEERKKLTLDHTKELRYFFIEYFNVIIYIFYMLMFNFFRRQIMERDELLLLNIREKREEGRKIKQKINGELQKLEAMRERKLKELHNMNVEEKFKSDLLR